MSNMERLIREKNELIEEASITINRLRWENNNLNEQVERLVAANGTLCGQKQDLEDDLSRVKHERDSMRALYAPRALDIQDIQGFRVGSPPEESPLERRIRVASAAARADRPARIPVRRQLELIEQREDFFDIEVHLSPPARRRRTQLEMDCEQRKRFNQTNLPGSTQIDLTKK